jgi:group I intron endonuclease
MYICRALLKHGYSSFSLEILEYCEPEKCLEREKHYWGLLNPEYNIAKDPIAPFSGRKHSLESIKKMSDANKGENHPNFGKTGHQNPMFGKKHSDETRQKMTDANKGENHPNFGKPKAEGAGKSSQVIEVTDISKGNTKTNYNSISAAARALNIDPSRISEYFTRNQKKPYKGIYAFKKL